MVRRKRAPAALGESTPGRPWKGADLTLSHPLTRSHAPPSHTIHTHSLPPSPLPGVLTLAHLPSVPQLPGTGRRQLRASLPFPSDLAEPPKENDPAPCVPHQPPGFGFFFSFSFMTQLAGLNSPQ